MKNGYVYILSNKKNGTLYIGVTSNLPSRINQHKAGEIEGFPRKYGLNRLVWYEPFENLHDARLVERQMKKWKRNWKINRIERLNPRWMDLSERLNE